MGNTHFAIPQKMNREWIQSQRNGHNVIQNTISHQFFRVHKIDKQLIPTPNRYIQRSIYSIPHTPKIIILDDTINSLYVMAQQPLSHIKFLVKKKSFLFQVLEILKDLMGVAWQLKQKYGSFEVKEEMMGIVKNQEVIMWINRRFEAVEVEVSLSRYQNDEEMMMIKNIINICQKYSNVDLTFLLSQNAGIINFESFIRQISIKIEIQKVRYTQKKRQTLSPASQIDEKKKRRTNNSGGIHLKIKEFDKKHQPSFNKHQRNFTSNEGFENIQYSKHQAKSYRHSGDFGKKRVTIQNLMISGHSTSESKLKNNEFLDTQIPSINLQGLERTEKSNISGSRALSTNKNFAQQSQNKLNKRITCSTEENVDREQRRQSTIRWVEEPEAGQKSIIDDYHCLFSKSGNQLSKKQLTEAFSKTGEKK